MELTQNIKNPSLVPNWFIYSGDKVAGIHDASGNEYQFVGASEKGEDGKTPILYISADDCRWYADYRDGRGPILVSQSPAASGLVGPQGETGLSGDSVKVDSIVNENNGTTVTLAWGENFTKTSSFFVPSGLSGANGKDGQNGISPTVTTATIEGTPGGIQVTISGADGEHQFDIMNGRDGAGVSVSAGTDLKIVNSIVQVNTNGIANSAGSAFVEGIDTVASGIASHAAGKNTSVYSDYSFVEGYQNTDYLITGLIGANHTEGAYNQVSGVYSHIEGHANTLIGYGVHMEGGYNIFESHNLTADKSDPIGRWNIWGQSIEGMANATTAEPTSGTEGADFGYVHGGILKVIGNGTRIKIDDSDPKSEVITRSDALILYRDGSMWVQGTISANGVELGAGGTSYQGRNGVNVDNDYIELTTTAYNAVTSVSSKVTKPDSSFVNKYLVLRTDNAGNVSGWYDLNEQCYSKSEATGTFQKKTDMTGYLTTAQYATDSSTFVISSSNTITGTKQYALTTTGWAEVQTGSISIPVNIGTGNNVYYGNNTAYGVIGNKSTAGRVSFAFGGGTFADNNSFAVNDANSANNNSIAAGWKSSADQYSYAFGHGQPENSSPNVATNRSLSVGEYCQSNNWSQSFGQANTTDNYSLAAGHANTATYYSYTFGRGLSFTGNSDASTGYGALVAGAWNSTNTNALFVLGNGTGNSNRKDAFVVDKNNNVFEGSVNTNNITGNTTHIEGGYNNISVYNTSVAGYNHIEGEANSVTGHSIHVEGAYNIFQSNSTADRGISIEGYANATSANDTSVHNGILKIIGNGERKGQNDIRRSDAYILYKDGTVSAKQFQNADGTETINGTTYSFTGVDNIEILPNAATASTANFPNDNVLRFILES